MKTYTSTDLSSPSNSALLEEIIHLITLAFVDDPWDRWFLNALPEKSYHTALHAYIAATVRLSILSDASVTILTTDDLPTSESKPTSTILALSMTIPPHGHATFDSTFAAIRCGAITLPFTVGFSAAYKLFVSFLPDLKKKHDQIFPDKATANHNYHLFYLVTHPEWQGKGLGSRVLREVKEQVRRVETEKRRKVEEEKQEQGKEKGYMLAPLYLEASTVDSRRLYARNGFEEKAVIVCGQYKEGDDVTRDKDGKVLGTRVFLMKCMLE